MGWAEELDEYRRFAGGVTFRILSVVGSLFSSMFTACGLAVSGWLVHRIRAGIRSAGTQVT
jgi:hypothetical protein